MAVEFKASIGAWRFAHRKGRAPAFTQYEPKPAGRRPDASACLGSRQGSPRRIPQGGRSL